VTALERRNLATVRTRFGLPAYRVGDIVVDLLDGFTLMQIIEVREYIDDIFHDHKKHFIFICKCNRGKEMHRVSTELAVPQ
jgi:hypothetical protein